MDITSDSRAYGTEADSQHEDDNDNTEAQQHRSVLTAQLASWIGP